MCAGLPHGQRGHTMMVFLGFDCTIIACLQQFLCNLISIVFAILLMYRFACNNRLIVVYAVFSVHLLNSLRINEFRLLGVEL